jgi:membrane-associated phospholipid phosphatase
VSAALAVMSAGPTRADPVLDWTVLALDCIRADDSSPTLSTRNLAILHTAIYDAVNSITRTHQPYRFQLDAPAGASPDAAAVGAAYEVLLDLYPPLEFWAYDLYESWLASTPHDSALTNGLAFGQAVALRVLDSRSTDGASTEVPYIPSNAPGQWQRTPPFFRPPLAPHWCFVDPFCLPDLEPFVPAPPPALDSPEYAAALNEVQAIGGKTSAVRTHEQSQIASFWSDFSYTATPPGHWHAIASIIAQSKGNTLEENALLFALLSLAQADAAIVCWEAKYRYNLWRPVTAIQRADEDGNPVTEADPAWQSLLATPPFPSYPSGHSTFSKASAEVLKRFYGTDAITFTATSDTLPGVVRTFHSLTACADEIGQSRIYGGFHFQFDNRAGKECGQKIGGFVAENFLLPNEQLPRLALDRAATGLGIRIQGHVGQNCVLETTTNFLTWQPVATNTAVAGGMTFTFPVGPPEPARFFRVREE